MNQSSFKPIYIWRLSTHSLKIHTPVCKSSSSWGLHNFASSYRRSPLRWKLSYNTESHFNLNWWLNKLLIISMASSLRCAHLLGSIIILRCIATKPALSQSFSFSTHKIGCSFQLRGVANNLSVSSHAQIGIINFIHRKAIIQIDRQGN